MDAPITPAPKRTRGYIITMILPRIVLCWSYVATYLCREREVSSRGLSHGYPVEHPYNKVSVLNVLTS